MRGLLVALFVLGSLPVSFRRPVLGRMVFSLLAMASTNMAFLFGLKAALAGVVTGLSTLFLLAFLRL